MTHTRSISAATEMVLLDVMAAAATAPGSSACVPPNGSKT